MDVTGKELRDRLHRWQLLDLAVGETGYVYGANAFCIRDDSLYIDGGAYLVERSDYATGYRVTLTPGQSAVVEIFPPKKEKRVVDRSDLDYFAVMRRCSYFEKLRDVVLIRVESVNGESRLSDILDKYLDDESRAAPGDAEEEEQTESEKRLADLLGGEGDQSWRVEEKVSKVDDSRNVFMYLSASNRVLAGYRLTRPSLIIRCKENTTAIYFNFDSYIGSDKTRPTVRIDKEPAREHSMPISTDHKAFGLWSGKTAIPFVKTLFGKNNLLVQVTPTGDSPVTAEFSVTGLQEAIGPLSKACHWQLTSEKGAAVKKPKEPDFFDIMDLDSIGTDDKPRSREMIQSVSVIGTSLTVSEKDEISRQIEKCWNVPIGARNPEELVVEIRIQVNRGRTVRDAVIVDSSRAATDKIYRAMAESARRAVMNPRCGPLKLPQEKYEEWKDLTLTFDPSMVVGR